MKTQIIFFWCLLGIGTLFSMNSERQIVPKNSHATINFDTLPDDLLITIIAFSITFPEIEHTKKDSHQIMYLVRAIMNMREISKKLAYALNAEKIISILRELKYTQALLSRPISLAHPLYWSARDKKNMYVHVIMALYPSNAIKQKEINHIFEEREHRTPALIAAHRGNDEALLEMLPYVDFNVRDFVGRNILMLAAHEQHWPTMQLLLAAGVDASEKDPIGRDIHVFTQTKETRETITLYETIHQILNQFPRKLIALMYAYLIEPIRVRRAHITGCS